MAGEARDELRMLRERAYGPSADIDRDAAAVERLRHLEGWTVTSETADPPAAPAEVVADPDPAPTPVDPPARPRRGIRRPLLWAGSVVVAGLLGFGVARTVDVVRTDALLPTARQVAVLRPDSSVPIPNFFTAEGQDPPIRMFQDFLGMRLVVGDPGWGAPQSDGRCLWTIPVTVVEAAGADGSYNGPSYYGCGAGSFPAVLTFTVADDLPDALRQSYPTGTSLQLVLDPAADDVVVYVDH